MIVSLSSAVYGATYSTAFPVTENPISEGGHWTNGRAMGIDWADVATSPGRAFGTQTGYGKYDDSTALLTGTWGADQTAEATVFVDPQSGSAFKEVELRLRSTLGPHVSTGYEINCSVNPQHRYLQIVRWNGALGSWTQLDGREVVCVMATS